MAVLDKKLDPEEREVIRDILIGVASGLAVATLYHLCFRRKK